MSWNLTDRQRNRELSECKNLVKRFKHKVNVTMHESKDIVPNIDELIREADDVQEKLCDVYGNALGGDTFYLGLRGSIADIKTAREWTTDGHLLKCLEYYGKMLGHALSIMTNTYYRKLNDRSIMRLLWDKEDE